MGQGRGRGEEREHRQRAGRDIRDDRAAEGGPHRGVVEAQVRVVVAAAPLRPAGGAAAHEDRRGPLDRLAGERRRLERGDRDGRDIPPGADGVGRAPLPQGVLAVRLVVGELVGEEAERQRPEPLVVRRGVEPLLDQREDIGVEPLRLARLPGGRGARRGRDTGGDDDAPGDAPGRQVVERRRDRLEADRAVDRGAQAPLAGEADHLGQLVVGVADRRAHLQLLDDELQGVEEEAVLRVADEDEATAPAQHRDAALHRLGDADELEDDVGPLVAGQAQGLDRRVELVGVDRHVGAQLGGERQLGRRPPDRDHPRAGQPAELDQRVADRPDAVDHDRLAEAHVGDRPDRVQRGRAAAPQGRGLLKGEAVRQGDEVAGRHGDVLGVAAVSGEAELVDDVPAEVLLPLTAPGATPAADVVVDRDALPRPHRRDPLADRGDGAGDLVAGDERGDAEVEGAVPQVQLGVADPGRADPDQRLAGARARDGDLVVVEGLAGAVVAHGAHRGGGHGSHAPPLAECPRRRAGDRARKNRICEPSDAGRGNAAGCMTGVRKDARGGATGPPGRSLTAFPTPVLAGSGSRGWWS